MMMPTITAFVLAAFAGYAGSWFLGMHEGNFALLLFMATVVSGIYWVLEKLIFLPQRPYLTTESLRNQVIYPYSYQEHVASGRTDEDLMEILKHVHLAYLPDREGGWGAGRLSTHAMGCPLAVVNAPKSQAIWC